MTCTKEKRIFFVQKAGVKCLFLYSTPFIHISVHLKGNGSTQYAYVVNVQKLNTFRDQIQSLRCDESILKSKDPSLTPCHLMLGNFKAVCNY